MPQAVIRPAAPGDLEAIKELAVETEMFGIDDMDFFDEMLSGCFDGGIEGHRWLVVEDGASVIAAANYAPEPFGHLVWNLYFIAVSPARQGQGLGSDLIGRGRGPGPLLGYRVERSMMATWPSVTMFRLPTPG